jgi:hypothetical protein
MKSMNTIPKQIASGLRKGAFLAFAGIALFIAFTLYMNHTPRWRENEYRAIMALKEYAAAQVLFSSRGHAAHAGNNLSGAPDNAFADNFRLLHYGVDEDGKRLALLSPSIADAFLVDNARSRTPTPPEAPTEPTPYFGYFFVEDLTERIPDDERAVRIPALMAFPERYGRTGRAIYWIGLDTGTIYEVDPKARTGTPAAELARRFFAPTPADGAPSNAWEKK